MAVSAQFRDHVLDLLAPLGGIDTRPMFGGLSIRCDGLHFAVIIADVLYLVADDGLRDELRRLGGAVFSYSRGTREVAVPRFTSVPEDMLEEPDRLLPFARRALAIASAG